MQPNNSESTFAISFIFVHPCWMSFSQQNEALFSICHRRWHLSSFVFTIFWFRDETCEVGGPTWRLEGQAQSQMCGSGYPRRLQHLLWCLAVWHSGQKWSAVCGDLGLWPWVLPILLAALAVQTSDLSHLQSISQRNGPNKGPGTCWWAWCLPPTKCRVARGAGGLQAGWLLHHEQAPFGSSQADAVPTRCRTPLLHVRPLFGWRCHGLQAPSATAEDLLPRLCPAGSAQLFLLQDALQSKWGEWCHGTEKWQILLVRNLPERAQRCRRQVASTRGQDRQENGATIGLKRFKSRIHPVNCRGAWPCNPSAEEKVATCGNWQSSPIWEPTEPTIQLPKVVFGTYGIAVWGCFLIFSLSMRVIQEFLKCHRVLYVVEFFHGFCQLIHGLGR